MLLLQFTALGHFKDCYYLCLVYIANNKIAMEK